MLPATVLPPDGGSITAAPSRMSFTPRTEVLVSCEIPVLLDSLAFPTSTKPS